MKPTKPTPQNWTRISSALFYDDAAAAIDWLCRAFGFELRFKVAAEDGAILHSELTYGEGLMMVAGPSPDKGFASPQSAGGVNTQHIMVYVDDVDAHCAHARAEGAIILSEPAVSDYGADHWADRAYAAQDPGGHRWWFAERIRGAPGGR